MADIAEVQARLVDAARGLFFTCGYGDTRMSAVATAARVSKTTLYAHFPSKEDLFRALVTRQVEGWDNCLQFSDIYAHKTLADALHAYADTMMAAALSEEFQQMNRLIYSEAVRFPELGRISVERMQRGEATIAAIIEVFAIREDVMCRDAAAAAALFQSILLGRSTKAMVAAAPVSVDERRDWLVRTMPLFLAGRAHW